MYFFKGFKDFYLFIYLFLQWTYNLLCEYKQSHSPFKVKAKKQIKK